MHIQNQNLNQIQYRCRGGVRVRRSAAQLDYLTAMDALRLSIDSRLGVLLASSFEYPGRYTRWDIGFVNPPLQLVGRGRGLSINALNVRGEILLPEIYRALKDCDAIDSLDGSAETIDRKSVV